MSLLFDCRRNLSHTTWRQNTGIAHYIRSPRAGARFEAQAVAPMRVPWRICLLALARRMSSTEVEMSSRCNCQSRASSLALTAAHVVVLACLGQACCCTNKQRPCSGGRCGLACLTGGHELCVFDREFPVTSPHVHYYFCSLAA